MLCCLLCLSVCAAPVLAANDEYTDGVIYPEPGLSINYTVGGSSIDVLAGYFPASFGSDSINSVDEFGRQFGVVGKPLPHPAGSYSFSSTTDSQFYIEVLFGVPAPLSFDLVQFGSTGKVMSKIGFGSPADITSLGPSSVSADISFVVDNKLIPLVVSSGHYFTPAFGTYDCEHYFGYRFYFNPLALSYSTTGDIALKLIWDELNVSYTFTDPNYLANINDKVTVNTGVLQEINGTLTDIKTSTVAIQNDVSLIKTGLNNSKSPIWRAFRDSVSNLFVPSSGDLEGVKNGFDQLAQDKLGGAYQTVELVDNGVQSVVDKIKNPGSSPGVEFPGISVPLGGDVGMVTLAASQTVTIPDKIKNVLYPVSSVIIPIVSVIWTIRQCLEMVEYFMSGMSYAEYQNRYLHEEDD